MQTLETLRARPVMNAPLGGPLGVTLDYVPTPELVDA